MRYKMTYEAFTEHWDCIFCEIISWNISTPGIFREDDNFIAFLSTRPNTRWMAVVTTKNHYSSDCLWLPDDVLKQFIVAAKNVSKILLDYFEDVGRVGLIMEWTWIDHAHIKLIPMHGTAHMKKWIWKQYLSDDTVFFDQYDWCLTSLEWPKANEEDIKKLAQQLIEIQNNKLQ